ncbi:RNA 2',3'-cyclic phosphodiesterase [Halomonas sp. HP20-15]|uniref:RNA 2',3'-cyclic phosphodiesterase n=1 Tax=Halomonas sp. HP20-15 TaxID=3085901 RepID=UPI0029813655|nr:RNA 2',3'-cyclic phosphodiesterase [Halomonas sp. HP20-15]MDW5375859.1 RNA 2',3'-cyclic phosphodiesterase [Halomonas sp. HP20-15]
MRLFFALWPEPALRERLAAIAARWRQTCGGRPIAAEKLHLTLAFVGDVAPARADALVAATGALTIAPGRWRLTRAGHFPRGGIAWLGSREASPALGGLHQRLAALGERHGGRPARVEPGFVPHVTLLRNAQRPPPEWPLAQEPSGLDWDYTTLALVHSTQSEGRHRYVELARSATPR